MMRWCVVVLILFSAQLATGQGRSIQEIANDLRVANDRQKQELTDVKSRLDWTWNELSKAEVQIRQVAVERDGWRSYGESEHDKWLNAEKRVASGKAGLLQRDIIIGLLILAIGAWAFLKFYLHIPFL